MGEDGRWYMMEDGRRWEKAGNWRKRMVGDDRQWDEMGDGETWHMVGNSRQCWPCQAGTQDP